MNKTAKKLTVITICVLCAVGFSVFAYATINYDKIYGISFELTEAKPYTGEINNYHNGAEMFTSTIRDGEYEKTLEVVHVDILLDSVEIAFIPELPSREVYAGVRAVFNDNSFDIIWSADAKWSSSDEQVAIVRENGAIVPTGVGYTTITMEYSGKSISQTIKVALGEVAKLEFAQESAVLIIDKGKTIGDSSLTLLAYDSDGHAVDVSRDASVELTSDDEGVLYFKDLAMVAKDVGEAKVTAVFGGQSVSISVDVISSDSIYDIELDIEGVFYVGYSTVLPAYAVYGDGERFNVQWLANWTSADDKVLSVASGFVDANAEGGCDLTVSFMGISKTINCKVIQMGVN